MKNCAILTMDSLDEFEVYDYLLDQPLSALGWQTQLISWREQQVNWNDYDAVIIRSPWDYQDDAKGFLKVLAAIEQSSAHLENSLAIVRWNIDKIYLQELTKKQVKIVPTLWQEGFCEDRLTTYFTHFDVEQIILKPRISANADNTFWLHKHNYQEHLAELKLAFSARAFMVQPFMESILNEGEYSLFYFNGQYSHAILKIPKNNDFRVQEEHGGRLISVEPENKLIIQAEKTLVALAEVPLYARLDFVRYQQSFALMEAELIEPSLYFNMDKNSAARFANAFVQRIAQLNNSNLEN
ncbi:MAG: hypothetical protein HRT52_03450 [Colwellia sp.]|nr:hypothetical protein [Colwellia sp.]